MGGDEESLTQRRKGRKGRERIGKKEEGTVRFGPPGVNLEVVDVELMVALAEMITVGDVGEGAKETYLPEFRPFAQSTWVVLTHRTDRRQLSMTFSHWDSGISQDARIVNRNTLVFGLDH